MASGVVRKRSAAAVRGVTEAKLAVKLDRVAERLQANAPEHDEAGSRSHRALP